MDERAHDGKWYIYKLDAKGFSGACRMKGTSKNSCGESQRATDTYASRSNLIGKNKLRDTRLLGPTRLSAVPRRESRPARSST